MSEVRYWIERRIPEIAMIFALVGVIVFVVAFTWSDFANRQYNIDLCVRAFDYTRDQCEFYIRNHVMTVKP